MCCYCFSAHRGASESMGKNEYMCKWQGLPYADSTWEDDDLITRKYGHKVAEYQTRNKSQRIPSKLTRVTSQII